MRYFVYFVVVVSFLDTFSQLISPYARDLGAGSLLMGLIVGVLALTTANQLFWIRFLQGIGGGLLIPAVFAFLGIVPARAGKEGP